MKQDNRVLARIQARELTEEEQKNVSGGIRTATVCSFGPLGADGDLGEC